MPGYALDDGETLKNKLGATAPEELEKREADLVARRDIEMRLGGGPEGKFDAEHLKAIHQHLFQDVYEWAGHTRDERVALSDGTTASEPILRKVEGQPFAIGPAIPEGLDALAERLREANYLHGLPREEFATRAADAMAELNGIHPFREGNGRTQRVFMEQLAEEAGHTLDFTVVSKERMSQASIAAHEHNDPSMMRRMFDEISDPERSKMLRGSIEQLEKLKFDWNERYVATLTPEHGVDLTMAGIAGEQFMARTENAILFGRTSDLPEPHPARGEQFRYGEAGQQQSVGAEADATRDFHGQADRLGAAAGDALEGAANLAEAALDTVADYSERAIDFIAESFASLFGGASAPPPARRAALPADGPRVDEGKEIARQTEDDRSKRRAQYLRDFDQEIPDELQQEAELSRGRGRGRTRGD